MRKNRQAQTNAQTSKHKLLITNKIDYQPKTFQEPKSAIKISSSSHSDPFKFEAAKLRLSVFFTKLLIPF